MRDPRVSDGAPVVPRCSAPSDLEMRGFLDESRNEKDPFLDGESPNRWGRLWQLPAPMA